MSECMLDGKVAVVTGAGRGIGRAEATRLAAYGARVVVNDVGVATNGAETGETPADEAVAEIGNTGGEAIADAHDISTPEGGEALVQTALDAWGRIDIVVNNAGIGRPHMVFNLEDAEWADVLRVHLTGTFSVSRPACRWWRAERAQAEEEAFDQTDPVHVAEMVCYLASPGAGWLSGQCFQVRGGMVEHVRTWEIDTQAERHDRGWTAADLAAEIPRLFGAGTKRADPPPKEWQEQYRRGRGDG